MSNATSPLVSIKVTSSESSAFQDGETFSTFAEFDRSLRKGQQSAPAGGAYDKVRFSVSFEDSPDAYGGRYDLNGDSKCSLSAQMLYVVERMSSRADCSADTRAELASIEALVRQTLAAERAAA